MRIHHTPTCSSGHHSSLSYGMSAHMLRSTWRSASTSSAWSAALAHNQGIAGPSRLRFAVPRCRCGEELVQLGARSSRRWLATSRAQWQATPTATHTSSPSPAPPLHSIGIDKTVPPPATVESPAPSSQQAPVKPAAPKPSRPARREIKAQKAAITLVSSKVCLDYLSGLA